MDKLRKILFIAFILLPAIVGLVWAVPAAVSDLSATSAGFRHVTLTWSAPYDISASTVASYYNIRCSTSTPIITDADWNNCPGSPSYPYNIAFSTRGFSAGGRVTFSVTGLADGRAYFFAIKSSTDNNFWSAIDTSTPRAFNTPFNTAPFTLQSYDSPPYNCEVYASTPTLSWHSDPETAGSDDGLWGDYIVTYTVELSTDVLFGIKTSNDVSTTWYITYPLAENTTYYWRVRPHDCEGLQAAGFLDQTNRWFIVNAIKDPPTPFSLISPTGSVILPNTVNMPQLQWSPSACADPAPEGNITYTIQYGTSSAFGVSCTTTVVSIPSSPYSVPSPLIENAEYFWRVFAVSGSSVSTICSSTGAFWVNAVVSGPGIFAPVSPPNTSIVRLSSPTLSWTPSHDPDPGTVITYNLLYSSSDITLSFPGEYNIIYGINTTWYVLPPLQDGSAYWWQAQANDGQGNLYQDTEWSFLVHAVDSPPNLFNLIASSGIFTTLKPTLSWQATNDPENDPFTYTLQYTTSDFSSPISSAGLLSTSFTPPVNLVDHSQYLWRVIATDCFGAQRVSNQAWPLITDTIHLNPAPFPLLSPPDTAQISYLAPTLVWQATTDPDPADSVASYTVRYSTSPDLSNATLAAGIVVTSYTITPPLASNTTYYWSVRAIAAVSGQQDATAQRSFFTVNLPPVAFSLIAPSGNVATLTPVLNWQAAADPEGDAVTYTVYYATNSAFINAISSAGIASNFYAAPPLIEDGSYYWKVDAVDVWGHVRHSTNVMQIAVNSVITPPTAPVLSAPANGAACGIYPALSWQASTDPDPGDSVGYELWYSSSNNLAPATIVSGITGLSYSITQSLSPGSGLSASSTWYWKVIAKDSEGNSTPSSIWSFVVSKAVAPDAPSNFNALSSSDGRTVTLTWQAPAVNADGTALTQLAAYRVYRAYDLNSLLYSVSASTMPALSSSFSEQISAGQTVFYQVSALNILGGESVRSLAVSAGAQGALLGYTSDCDITISCPPNVVPSSVTLSISRNSDKENNAVLRNYTLHVISGGVELKNFIFAGPITLSLNSSAIASAVSSSPRKAPDALLTTGIFWNNGVEWIYLGGQNSNGGISARASSAGEYELRIVSRASEFHVLSHWPAIITPNGDNINDEFNITFENPMSDSAQGDIYSLSGAHVAKMSAKTDTWYIWNGYSDNGGKAAPGIYIYQIKCGSKLFNGTVVVAK